MSQKHTKSSSIEPSDEPTHIQQKLTTITPLRSLQILNSRFN